MWLQGVYLGFRLNLHTAIFSYYGPTSDKSTFTNSREGTESGPRNRRCDLSHRESVAKSPERLANFYYLLLALGKELRGVSD